MGLLRPQDVGKHWQAGVEATPEVSLSDPCISERFSAALRTNSPQLHLDFGRWWMRDSLGKHVEDFAHDLQPFKNSWQSHWSSDVFYLVHLDLQKDPMRSMMHHASRPLVLIGPPHLRTLACRWFPTKVAFIHAPMPGNAAHCDADDKARVKTEMLQQSEKFPDETVTFVFAGGPFMKIVAAEVFFEAASMQRKDLIIDAGSSLDGAGGKTDRDYNKNWHKNCLDFAHAMSCEVCHSHCGKDLCAGCVSNKVYEDDCRAVVQ